MKASRGSQLRDAGDAFELVEGRVFALGGASPVDGRLSWIDADVVGHAPLHCYLMIAGDEALLLDTSAPVYEHQVLHALEQLVPDPAALNLMMSRVVEFDSFGNAAAVMRRYPLSSVHSQFPVDEWVFYRVADDIEARPAPSNWQPLKAGQPVGIGSPEASERVEVIEAPLRLLVTFWTYDPVSRVLFTSDSFGHSVLAAPDDQPMLTAERDELDVATVRSHLLAKFDWLTAADLGPVREQIRAIFDSREIDVIAPSYGRPIVGADVVRRHYGLLMEALAQIDAERDNRGG